MVIYSYPVEKKRKISYRLSSNSSFLMFWNLLGLGRDSNGAYLQDYCSDCVHL